MSRLNPILVLAFVVVVLSSGFAARSEDPQEPAAPVPAPEAQFVPIGGVLLWWGMESELPPGFEVCDGKSPTSKGAVLKDRKPDLRDRFAKGVKDFSSFRPLNAKTGGSNSRGDLTTETHVLTVNEIPKHTHPIAHTHTVPAHEHRIGDHVHAIGEFESIAFSNGPDSAVVLKQHAAPAPATTEPPPAGGMTGPSMVLTTSAATPAVSGENAWTAGRLQGHSHILRGGDTLPAFLEMIWIIRVK